jgi:two-component system response regulator VanR
MTAPKILCTEDDADTRELLVAIRAGFDATCVKSAEEAVTCVESTSFDLYIVDNWLPNVSGISLCEQLRQRDKTTPILLYSGAALETDLQNAYSAGAQGYLVKPVSPAVLVAEVSRLIEEAKTGLVSRPS